MLEVMDGNQPFPRVIPPYLEPGNPELVNNAETMANVPGIIANGADWYRGAGTDASPGTIVCTVSGDMINHGVAEFEMGTPLSEVIDHIGWRLETGDAPLMVLNGASNPPILPDRLDTPLTHDDMAAAGTGLGSASFIVFDERRDPLAIAEGVARFLEVESCGQCEPCKRDGLAIANHLRVIMGWGEGEIQHEDLLVRLDTVARGARCNLARQTEGIVGAIFRDFAYELQARVDGKATHAEPIIIAPIRDIVEGQAVLDERQVTKQPDWTHDERDSGTWPAARLEDTPVHISLPPSASNSEPDESRGGSFSENPFELVAHDHHLIHSLFEVVREHPDDHDSLSRLGEEIREHCDMGATILAPMVSRYGGAEGDDIVYGPEEGDRLIAVEAGRLSTSGNFTAEALDRLSSDFAEHIAAERPMLDLLRRTMDPEALRDLARAMVEGELTA